MTNLERLSEKCNKPPIMEFERFVLRPFDGHLLFLENPEGGGCTVTRMEFLVLIQKLFERNF